jgi:hypothetical protein
MIITPQQIIYQALRALGEIEPGQTPNPEESAAGLEVLNTLLDNWMAQHRKVYHVDHKQFGLEAGKQTYTMGPGGDFDTERPVKIQRAGLMYYKTDANDMLQGLRKNLEIVNAPNWASIPEKGMTACEPLKLYDNNAYPLKTLSLWPIPTCCD